ncbi:Tab2/Atab2 family RNA-binding protein [Phormidium sp. CCY1219]|uniref:Tab2/Atab2 family RNA-binding protein n=1 Tax=Phormidium sp. CCY1219 TaxID=2886104 RepID=UPI002D1F093E|nr:Tab2/Atab2 family RNA-binding protein [Phormidium sp. CCY1219]MEB3831725.1 Tab2/Atab2 family RNA-binding protein [Phormidium sp. CCY1219]
MQIWQADFYRRPLQNERGERLWELAICDRAGDFRFSDRCVQSEAKVSWLVDRLHKASAGHPPAAIEVFRPQSLSLIQEAGKQLGVPVIPTRRTQSLKQWLLQKSQEYANEPNYTHETYDPLAVDRPPPIPLPEELWGDRWRFARVSAGYLLDVFGDRPIPIRSIPESLNPFNLGLASTVAIPGAVVDGGRQSMRLARWLEAVQPVALNYIPGAPDGLILEAGLSDRWVLATFEDKEVAAAGLNFQQHKQLCKGLHFLLVQPDDSGQTYTGFWLLQNA